MKEFQRMDTLPTYIFSQLDDLKCQAMLKGEPIIDFGMGNPDGATPEFIVETLRQSVLSPENHRYSTPKGIYPLRKAICQWYAHRFGVQLNPETQSITTLGVKEGLAHLALAMISLNDTVLCQAPCYPIHHYGFVLAGARVEPILLDEMSTFIERLDTRLRQGGRIKALMISFPANPTGDCVDLDFFEQIIERAKQYNFWVIHDLAYADLGFDGYHVPSILQVPGANDVAVEAYSLSKSYNMPGWRVGFMCGNSELIGILSKIKTYLDYGHFIPIQQAAIAALQRGGQGSALIRQEYQLRRDALCQGLCQVGWPVKKPLATMFVWAPLPPGFSHLGSFEFCKELLNQAKVAVSPGVGFGMGGQGYVRFSLIQNEPTIKKACQQIKVFLNQYGRTQGKEKQFGTG